MPNFKDQFEYAIAQLEPDRLKAGDSGMAVYHLQLALAALRLYTVTIDGDFGPETLAAVQRLQSQQGLPVTGEFNPETWYALTFWSKPPR